MDFVSGLSATKTGLELIRTLRDVLKRPEVDAHEVSNRLMELQELLIEARGALSEAQEDNRRLKAALEAQDEQKKLESDVVFEQDGQFWVKKSEREQGLIPYCPACWGTDKKLVVMALIRPGFFRCPIHDKHSYTTSAYEEWKSKQPQPQRGVRSTWLSRF